MRRIVRLDLALLILLWSVGYSLFIFADSLRRSLIPHRESASGLVQEYGVFQSREDFSDSLGGVAGCSSLVSGSLRIVMLNNRL